jgi:hypothetical protein
MVIKKKKMLERKYMITPNVSRFKKGGSLTLEGSLKEWKETV